MHRILVFLVAFAAPAVALASDGAVTAAPNDAGSAAQERPRRVDLAAREHKVFSQFGEDGVIEAIFEIIEPTRRFVVEFGAYDAVVNSNSRNLILNHGWSAFLIEGHEGRAKLIAGTYRDNPNVRTLQAWVYPGNIEILFEENGVPRDLDLLVIDIDSNDYYVWRAIRDFRPKVVMVEINPSFPPPRLMVIDFHPMTYWDNTSYAGASLQSYYNLAKKKGYELVHCMGFGPNAFFVDEKYYERFGIDDNSPVQMFKMWGRAPEGPEVFPEGKRYLPYKGRIEKRFILDR